MWSFIESLLIRLILLLGIVCLVLLALSTDGCGPLSPHVNVDAKVDGKVDTSGAVTIKLDVASLGAFFTEQCTAELGPSATQAQVAKCSADLTANFLQFVPSLKTGA